MNKSIMQANPECEENNVVVLSQIEAKNQELSLVLQQLQATQQQLRKSEKMATLGNLIAGMAHEINTPIGIGVTAISHLKTKIGSFLELYQNNQMKRSDLEKFLNLLKETMPLVLSNLERAAQLVNSFKQVAVDQQSEEKRVFNMRELLDNVLLTLRPKLKRTQHKIEIECEDGLMLNSYPGAFSQIVTQLVINSLTHGYANFEEGTLTFHVSSDTGVLKFEYSDQGRGIPSDLLSKISESFSANSLGQGGMASGLNMVYHLVTQRLGGVVRMESEVGPGTRVIIEIPGVGG